MSNMKNHLTERELIEYQFKLADENRVKEIAGHLESCTQCSEQLEKIQRKFATLDLLRDQGKVSEDLISQVVEQAKKSTPTKILFFGRHIWLSAAAVLLLGLLLISNTGKQEKRTEDAFEESIPETTTMELAEEPRSTTPTDLDRGDSTETLVAKDMPKIERAKEFSFRAGADVAETEQIPEQPPFAPASAIELVTLPQRDNVQLTIYNSARLSPVTNDSMYGAAGESHGRRSSLDYENFTTIGNQVHNLTMLIEEAIDPMSWYNINPEAEGSILKYNNKLVIYQTLESHRQIEKLLRALNILIKVQGQQESSSAINGTPNNRIVYEQLEQVVDLSELKPEMAFKDVLNTIARKVNPPLQFVPNWRDLELNAQTDRATLCDMDPLTGIKISAALDVLLAGLSDPDAPYYAISYLVDEGVIRIATEYSLPSNMETRVYDIIESAINTDIISDSDQSIVEENEKRIPIRNFAPRKPAKIPPIDLTLVRERRNLTLKKGWNWLQFMWANTLIDPTSLSLEAVEQKDKIEIQQLVFPARLRELGRWLIHSEVSGRVPFELTYLTSGLTWRAFYMGTLSQDEKSMHLQGYVRVTNNSGEDYENAQTRLIVGQVHMLDKIADLAKRQFPYGSPMPVTRGGGYGGMGGGMGGYDKAITLDYGFRGEVSGLKDGLSLMKPKEIVKEGLSEYFLYTIEGTETIPNGWGKRLLSFEAEDIKIESLYKYDERRWGNQTMRFLKFANDTEHNLGNTPIPDGNIRIYGLTSENGYLSYVGRTDIKYIPVNEEVELNLDPARLVEVEPTLMNFKTDNYLFDPNENITGWDEIRSWKIEITNTRTLPVKIEITRGFDTAYWRLACDIPYEKHDATRIRFNLDIEPRTKRTFEYTVTTYHGTREETINQ